MKESHPAPPAEAADESCFSPFSCLPDDVVSEIIKKITDLKTLCVCQVVSKRFYEIAHQADAICYTTPSPSIQDFQKCKSFDSAMTSLKKFVRVKYLCIESPYPTECSIATTNNNNVDVLYKSMVKVGEDRLNSLVLVSPSSVYNNNGLFLYGEEKEDGDRELALKISEDDCFQNGFLYLAMMNHIAGDFPSLEKVSFTDSDNRGMVYVNRRGKFDDLTICLNDYHFPDRIFVCYVRLLELPVSGYVMKGVVLFLLDFDNVPNDATYDSFFNDEIDIKNYKEEAAYHEAIKEIFKKHRGSFVRSR